MKIPEILLALLVAGSAGAQILVDPPAANVNAQGASTVFLSYGQVRADQYSVEALWCGGLVSAAPDIGMKCDPASTWGRLPLRNDLSRPSGTGGFTDIMTIPQNVARRAYQRATRGTVSEYFYVRRFASVEGKPDEYIPIRLRLTGGGASVPLALTNAKLRFATDRTVLSTPVGVAPPALYADLEYTGTGRLRGRWEVAVPGNEPPAESDLVPEASLPIELRGTQRRYTQLSRFDLYLAPTGKARLDGPDVTKLPTGIEGLYQILLRIEATDDATGTTDLSGVGSGQGAVVAGGVAGFAIPPLRYYVGSIDAENSRADPAGIVLRAPAPGAALASGDRMTFAWESSLEAAHFKLELLDAQGASLFSAIVAGGATKYEAPSFLGAKLGSGERSWRIYALDSAGREVARSSLASFTVGATPDAAP